jgi:hypothetical protein
VNERAWEQVGILRQVPVSQRVSVVGASGVDRLLLTTAAGIGALSLTLAAVIHASGSDAPTSSRTPFSQRGHVRVMSVDLTPRDAIELLLTAKNQAAVHYGQVTLTVEQVDQIIGALGAVR